MRTWVFDKLDTADSYEIYWLYETGKLVNEFGSDMIDPDDLYYDRDAFYEKCRDIVLEDEEEDWINYAIDESQIEEWKQEDKDANDFYNEISNTYPS